MIDWKRVVIGFLAVCGAAAWFYITLVLAFLVF